MIFLHPPHTLLKSEKKYIPPEKYVKCYFPKFLAKKIDLQGGSEIIKNFFESGAIVKIPPRGHMHLNSLYDLPLLNINTVFTCIFVMTECPYL